MRSKSHINNYIAHRVREVRAEKKISAQEMSRRTGIAPGSYSCLENGWYRINLDNLFKILKGLDASVTDVWPRDIRIKGDTIDEDYLREAVEKSLNGRLRQVALDDVYRAVCSAFDISKDKLLSRMKNWRRLTQARAACAILVRETPGLTLSSLAGSIGCSLSSISHLARRYSEKIETDRQWESLLNQARLDLNGHLRHQNNGDGPVEDRSRGIRLR